MTAGLASSLGPVRFEDLPEQTWPRQEIIDGSLLGTCWILDPARREVQEFGSRPRESCWLSEIDHSSFWRD